MHAMGMIRMKEAAIPTYRIHWYCMLNLLEKWRRVKRRKRRGRRKSRRTRKREDDEINF